MLYLTTNCKNLQYKLHIRGGPITKHILPIYHSIQVNTF